MDSDSDADDDSKGNDITCSKSFSVKSKGISRLKSLCEKCIAEDKKGILSCEGSDSVILEVVEEMPAFEKKEVVVPKSTPMVMLWATFSAL